MPTRLLTVAFPAVDPARLAGFWAVLLDRSIAEDGPGHRLPGEPGQIGLRFVPGVYTGPNLMHLHLASTTPQHQRETVARALSLGAHHLDVGQSPEDEHVVLADPEGNAFCVIEPGNSFLSGCGFLAEVACDGTRAVGVFWSQALDWPLVWDRDEETAIQSPEGGTKVAWSGTPAVPAASNAPAAPTRAHLDLTAAGSDPAAEIDRLIRLGATRRGVVEGAVVLADPDGVEFRVLTA